MAHDDPFTIDLFGNTALASGFDLGVPSFAAEFGTDIDIDPPPSTPAPAVPVRKEPKPKAQMRAKVDFRLQGFRGLAKTWRDRARDNIAAILLANEIERHGLPARPDQQERLIKFTGFGASDLANGIFRRPGDEAFRKGWEELGGNLESAVAAGDYASLARCTQYALFTPEFIVRAIWSGLIRMGFKGGRILEPGIGSGMFPALMPETLAKMSHVTGVELDPVTVRIVRLLQPRARIITGDFSRVDLPDHFDLAIGNPPFSDRTVKSDPAFRSLGFRLHDYFIARSIDRLKPGGLAAFVTSSGTMDKADARAREHIAGMADLVGAIRLPEGSFRADAGTDVVVDILFFRKRRADDQAGSGNWLDHADVQSEGEGGRVRVNRWFADHPEMVLGRHAITSGPFGETYTCQPTDDDLETILKAAIERLPADIDLRLVDQAMGNETANKLNTLVTNTHRIWQETGEAEYRRKDGKAFDRPGAGQLIFSDLGTINVEAARGFSAYRWIRDELVRLGVPASEIAFMQDYKKSDAKQRLFNDFNAGKVRLLIGSSETMGTGVNVQARLKALHHLDVPWLPSQIEQREGRIIRQGNQHDEVDVFAYRPSLKLERRDALWAIKALRDEPLPLFAAAAEREAATIAEQQEPEVALRQMTDGHNVIEDYSHTGLTLRQHPIAFLRKDLAARNIITCAEAMNARDGRWVYTAGLVLVRQKPGSAKGVMFITIEDETGPANLVVWPKLFEKSRRIVLGSSMMAIQGKIQREGEVVHLIARQLFDLTADLSGLADRDAEFKLPAGRGDEFAHGGGPDSRDRPKQVVTPRDLFVRDLHIDTLKVKARNFQ